MGQGRLNPGLGMDLGRAYPGVDQGRARDYVFQDVLGVSLVSSRGRRTDIVHAEVNEDGAPMSSTREAPEQQGLQQSITRGPSAEAASAPAPAGVPSQPGESQPARAFSQGRTSGSVADGVATVGIVPVGTVIQALVPGTPAHSAKVLHKGDTILSINKVGVDETNLLDALRGEDNVGEVFAIRVRKTDRSTAEVRLRSVPVEAFAYQCLMIEALVRLEQSCQSTATFAHGLINEIPASLETRATLKGKERDMSSACKHAVEVFSEREFSRAHRERVAERERDKFKFEIDGFKHAYADRQKDVSDLTAELNQTRSDLETLVDGDFKTSLEHRGKLRAHNTELKREIWEQQRLIHQLSGQDASYQQAVDKVGALTETTLTQTAEIFRLNELVIRMDSELKQTQIKLRHREMESSEAMHRWHEDPNDDDPFGQGVIFDPSHSRSLAGTFVPAS